MKRVLKTFLLSILLVMTLGTIAQAKKVYNSNYVAIATKQNTWYNPKMPEQTYNGNSVWTNTYYRYKVTVPSNYYLTLTIKSKDYAVLYLYKALNANWDNNLDSYSNESDPRAKAFNIALPKGTYYLGNPFFNVDNFAFKYKLNKYVTKTNFKSSRAVTLLSGRKLAIIQLPGHNYERWYKIKVKKRKRIYISGARDIDLFNAKRQPLDVRSSDISDNSIYYSYNKLNPGIYYIRVLGARPRDSNNTWHGSVEIIWWK